MARVPGFVGGTCPAAFLGMSQLRPCAQGGASILIWNETKSSLGAWGGCARSARAGPHEALGRVVKSARGPRGVPASLPFAPKRGSDGLPRRLPNCCLWRLETPGHAADVEDGERRKSYGNTETGKQPVLHNKLLTALGYPAAGESPKSCFWQLFGNT